MTKWHRFSSHVWRLELRANLQLKLPCLFLPWEVPQIFPTQPILVWLVVWTPLKNISQLGWLFPIYGKKNVPNHQPVTVSEVSFKGHFYKTQLYTPLKWWCFPAAQHVRHAQAQYINAKLNIFAESSSENWPREVVPFMGSVMNDAMSISAFCVWTTCENPKLLDMFLISSQFWLMDVK